VEVNNSTNINKKNNHLSTQTTQHKKRLIYDIGNHGLGLGQAQKCGRVKIQPVNGIPYFSMYKNLQNVYIYMYNVNVINLLQTEFEFVYAQMIALFCLKISLLITMCMSIYI